MSETTESSPMRDAEEVARAAFHPPSDDPDRPDPAGPLSGSEWYEYALRHAERVIRERDDEVRAAVLAEFEVETRTREDGHAGWAGDRFGGLNSGRMIFRHATRERRLVGPWEPTT